jgi:hypothetical protein
MTIHVTDTQAFILKAAFEIATEGSEELDQHTCDAIVRAMLLIERSGMQPYFFKGFKWSCWSRAQGNHAQVEADFDEFERHLDAFNNVVALSRGHAASRIRANRVRSIKAIEGHDMQALIAEARFGQNWHLRWRGADNWRFGQQQDPLQQHQQPDAQVNVA